MVTKEEAALYQRICDDALTPVYESYSLHLVEERYEVDGKLYTVLLTTCGELFDVEPYREPINYRDVVANYRALQAEAQAQLGHS